MSLGDCLARQLMLKAYSRKQHSLSGSLSSIKWVNSEPESQPATFLHGFCLMFLPWLSGMMEWDLKAEPHPFLLCGALVKCFTASTQDPDEARTVTQNPLELPFTSNNTLATGESLFHYLKVKRPFLHLLSRMSHSWVPLDSSSWFSKVLVSPTATCIILEFWSWGDSIKGTPFCVSLLLQLKWDQTRGSKTNECNNRLVTLRSPPALGI